MTRVSDLAGAELALWVGRATGADFGPDCKQGDTIITGGHSGHTSEVYEPHEDWTAGGPLIEKHKIELSIGYNTDRWEWHAQVRGFGWMRGPTPLIAAMRALVASVFGDSVPEVTP